MKAVLCPVCNGVGKVTPNYDAINPDYKLPCHGCKGRGWVEVAEDYFPGAYGGTPYVDRCPACGGDRNSPAGTGCPMGSHFGSYCDA